MVTTQVVDDKFRLVFEGIELVKERQLQTGSYPLFRLLAEKFQQELLTQGWPVAEQTKKVIDKLYSGSELDFSLILHNFGGPATLQFSISRKGVEQYADVNHYGDQPEREFTRNFKIRRYWGNDYLEQLT